MVKTILAVVILLGVHFSAFAADEKFEGRCVVLQQEPFQLLADVNVALKSGETKTIYTKGNIRYEVSVIATPGNRGKDIYNLQTVITYGDPHYLAEGTASYSAEALQDGAVIGAGVSLPGFPSFGCGNAK